MTPLSRCVLGNSPGAGAPAKRTAQTPVPSGVGAGSPGEAAAPPPRSGRRAHRRGRACNLRAAGPARRRLGRRPGMRPRDLLLLRFAAGAHPSNLRPWLLGPGRRRLRRRRRRRRRWLRRRRRPAQPAMSLAATGDAPRLVGVHSQLSAHGGLRISANCSRRRRGSQDRTANGPTAARAALRACARTRWNR